MVQEMIDIENPIFISGHPRSGTNLLLRLIDGSQGVFVPPGEGKLNILRRFYGKNSLDLNEKETAFKQIRKNIELNLNEDEESKVSNILKNTIKNTKGCVGIYGLINILLSSLKEYRAENNNEVPMSRWIEKNHNIEFYWGRAKTLFGNPKLLFVSRDPIGNWASWKQYCKNNDLKNDINQARRNISSHLINEIMELSYGIDRFNSLEKLSDYYALTGDSCQKICRILFGNKSYGEELEKLIEISRFDSIDSSAGRFAWNYKIMTEKVVSLSACYPDNVMVVKFEDMIDNTETIMRSLLDFCGLEFNTCNLIPTSNGIPWIGNSSFAKESDSGINASAMRRGHADLPENEVNIINKVLQDFVKK